MSAKRPAAELFAVDPLDPKNHDKPLWCVYGHVDAWPQLLCCKLKVHHQPRTYTVIWGYSVYKRQPGFRTLGIDVKEWIDRWDWGPFFYDEQSYAIDHLREVTTPKRSKA